MNKLYPSLDLAQDGAVDGQSLTWSAAAQAWLPASASAPLFADDGSGSPLFNEAGDDWLYPDA